ncbi:MAG: methyl-accepting chemotaxis protein [Geobacter sp.]|nr:methyl-accepting chemotaxis protein [Geobacter sp.]
MLRNVKIGVRLVGGFFLVVLITAIIGTLGFIDIKKLDEASLALYEKGVCPLEAVGEISTAFQRLRVNTRDIIMATDGEEVDEHGALIRKYREEIDATAIELEKGLPDNESKKLFATFVETRKSYTSHLDKIVELARANRDKEAQLYMEGTAARQAADNEMAAIDSLSAYLVKSVGAVANQNHILSTRSGWIITALTLTGAIVAFVLGLLLSRSITVPLRSLTAQSTQIASGDLSVKITHTSGDEIGQLSDAFRNMAENLHTTIKEVAETSTQVASAANQLMASAERIATGAEEVAAQAGTVATAGEEMAATSADIAHNCQMAAEGSHHASNTATAGAEVVNLTVSVMGQIAGRVKDTASAVEGLGSRSDQIGAIIGTIEDIADQTNLLALNAAIEAARAGEQGRGFAVVADEVRALAERTTTATREIGEMIKAIQSETKSAVTAMEEGVREVEHGTDEAAKSGQALSEILAQINSVVMQVNQVATAAEEQTATTGDISKNIHQITEVVQDTANGAHESATAAGQLAGLAESMQRLVGQFKLAA